MADTEQTQTEQEAATVTETTETTQTTDLGDKGKAAIQKERDARKEAEKRAKEAEDRLAEVDAEKAAKEEADAKAKGEYEKLATDRLDKLTKLQTDHKTLAEERDALLAKVQAREDQDKAEVATWIKDHKGIVDEFLDYYPGADAPADAQMAWYAATRPKVEKRVTDPVRGNGRSPESANGRDTQADEAARLAQARTTSRGF